MPAQPASATAASNRNDPIEIIMACESTPDFDRKKWAVLGSNQ
jgi:hypothetical protein